jgi:hypothetical protein
VIAPGWGAAIGAAEKHQAAIAEPAASAPAGGWLCMFCGLSTSTSVRPPRGACSERTAGSTHAWVSAGQVDDDVRADITAAAERRRERVRRAVAQALVAVDEGELDAAPGLVELHMVGGETEGEAIEAEIARLSAPPRPGKVKEADEPSGAAIAVASGPVPYRQELNQRVRVALDHVVVSMTGREVDEATDRIEDAIGAGCSEAEAIDAEIARILVLFPPGKVKEADEPSRKAGEGAASVDVWCCRGCGIDVSTEQRDAIAQAILCSPADAPPRAHHFFREGHDGDEGVWQAIRGRRSGTSYALRSAATKNGIEDFEAFELAALERMRGARTLAQAVRETVAVFSEPAPNTDPHPAPAPDPAGELVTPPAPAEPPAPPAKKRGRPRKDASAPAVSGELEAPREVARRIVAEIKRVNAAESLGCAGAADDTEAVQAAVEAAPVVAVPPSERTRRSATAKVDAPIARGESSDLHDARQDAERIVEALAAIEVVDNMHGIEKATVDAIEVLRGALMSELGAVTFEVRKLEGRAASHAGKRGAS